MYYIYVHTCYWNVVKALHFVCAWGAMSLRYSWDLINANMEIQTQIGVLVHRSHNWRKPHLPSIQTITISMRDRRESSNMSTHASASANESWDSSSEMRLGRWLERNSLCVVKCMCGKIPHTLMPWSTHTVLVCVNEVFVGGSVLA